MSQLHLPLHRGILLRSAKLFIWIPKTPISSGQFHKKSNGTEHNNSTQMISHNNAMQETGCHI